MKMYNIGIIGVGMWGKVLTRCFQEDERARVLWVNSASETTTKAAAREFNIEKWTLDYRDILSDSEIDAVAISTPPYLHAQQLTDALQAGKHVLIEKPLAESPDSLEKILKVSKAAKQCIVLEASARHTRLTPKYRFIKSFIESGKLGEVYHIHHNHLTRGTFIEYNPKGEWAMNKKLSGGGPFIDWGVYDLSFHLGLLDDKPELLSVRNFMRNDLRDMKNLVAFSDVEQHGAAWLEFTEGLSYYYERGAGVHSETTNETRIYGTKGGLRFQFPSWDSNDVEYFYCDDTGPKKKILTVDRDNAHDDSSALTTHFLDCLDGKSSPSMSVQLAAKHLKILFGLYMG